MTRTWRGLFWGWFGATAVHCAVPRCPESTSVAATSAPVAASESDAVHEPADAGFSTGLSASQVKTVVMSAILSFQACYERALANDPGAKGGIIVAFLIAPDGTVSSATVSSSSMGKPDVETCMAEEVRKLKFPAAEKPTHAKFPFVFKGVK